MQYDVTIRIIGASNVIKYNDFTNHFESSLKCNHKNGCEISSDGHF